VQESAKKSPSAHHPTRRAIVSLAPRSDAAHLKTVPSPTQVKKKEKKFNCGCILPMGRFEWLDIACHFFISIH